MMQENVVGTWENDPEVYDLMTVVLLCLGPEVDEGCQSILRLLGVLLSSEKAPGEKKHLLEAEYGIAMQKELEKEVNVMCYLSDGIVERAEVKGEAKLVAMIRRKMEKGFNAEDAADQLELDAEYVQRVMKLIGETPDSTDLSVAKILVQR